MGKTPTLPDELWVVTLGWLQSESLWVLRPVSKRWYSIICEMVVSRITRQYKLRIYAPSPSRKLPFGAQPLSNENGSSSDHATLYGVCDCILSHFDPHLGSFEWIPEHGGVNFLEGKGRRTFDVSIMRRKVPNLHDVVARWEMDVDVGHAAAPRRLSVHGNVILQFAWRCDCTDLNPERRAWGWWTEGFRNMIAGRNAGASVAASAEGGGGSFTRALFLPGRLFRALQQPSPVQRRRTVHGRTRSRPVLFRHSYEELYRALRDWTGAGWVWALETQKALPLTLAFSTQAKRALPRMHDGKPLEERDFTESGIGRLVLRWKLAHLAQSLAMSVAMDAGLRTLFWLLGRRHKRLWRPSALWSVLLLAGLLDAPNKGIDGPIVYGFCRLIEEVST